MRTRLVTFLTTALIACSGSKSTSTGPPAPTATSVTGNAGGHPLVATETLGLVGVNYAGFILSNQTGTCPLLQAGRTAPPNSAFALLKVTSTKIGPMAPPDPGTYPLGVAPDQNSDATLAFEASDSSCSVVADLSASSGTVTFDTVTANVVAGSFDVTLSSGEHISGNFDGPVCNVDLSTLGNNGGACGGDQ
jgi:hypothetical protein